MKTERCCGEVWGESAYRSKQCSRSGSMEHDGRFYCATHHPPTIDARNKAKHEKWDKERAASNDRYKREAYAEKLLARFTTEELKNAVDVELVIQPALT